ncbi:MAG: WecB/TagA/CpsF family glycosyltransferase [Candidatus Neomarinimicrobiota bacterium]
MDYTTYDQATRQILDMAHDGRGGYVCVCTVHMVMEGHDDPEFQRIVNGADLVTPDGMPLVWGLKLLGVREAERVYGPTLTPVVCREAAKQEVMVGFYGGTEEVLSLMQTNLKARYPSLEIAYAYSPPFRSLTAEESGQVVKDIQASGAKILFVGLGCPKQERWMASYKERLPGVVMLGVGAAFDFIAGMKPQAPGWMQRAGLEWLFRLLTEPRRLWKRYIVHNPRFMLYFAQQLLGWRNYTKNAASRHR